MAGSAHSVRRQLVPASIPHGDRHR